jgi:hypothetical protein
MPLCQALDPVLVRSRPSSCKRRGTPVRRRTVAVQTVQRFRLVLVLHQQPSLSNEEAGRIVGLSARQV